MISFPPAPPPRLVYEPVIRRALTEDLGDAGDLTTQAIAPPDEEASGHLIARTDGVVAGLAVVAGVFAVLDPAVAVSPLVNDGNRITAGQPVAYLTGPARALLTGERVALNFLCHLSGVATATAAVVEAVVASRAKVVPTRKTLPGLRALQRYAVRAGGGADHRFGLDDAVLVKDNHVIVAGSLEQAVRRVRAGTGHMVKIEVEVDTLDQLEQALALNVDAVLLDNMPPGDLAPAVEHVDRRAVCEASGGITRDNAAEVASAGVDLISVGWLTHSAPALDVGFDLDRRGRR